MRGPPPARQRRSLRYRSGAHRRLGRQRRRLPRRPARADPPGGRLPGDRRLRRAVESGAGRRRYVRPRGPARLYGNATRLAARVFGGPGSLDEALLRASPVTYVRADAPPFLLVHGAKDRLVPVEQSRLLHEGLTEAGASSTLLVVENADHVFVPNGGPISPTRPEIMRRIADFFVAQLRPGE
ncbi:MAG: prolyl oligopeptidase family serine peptidase [Dehalococcoidia bacterium]